MNMLQRIVSAFAIRGRAEQEARAEMPVPTDLHRMPSNSGPAAEFSAESDDGYARNVDIDPSIAARRLWCSADHF